jgi:hypothetical protein
MGNKVSLIEEHSDAPQQPFQQQVEILFQSCQQQIDTVFQSCQQQIDTVFQSCQQQVETVFQSCQQQVETVFQSCQQQVETVFQSCQQHGETPCSTSIQQVKVSSQPFQGKIEASDKRYQSFKQQVEKVAVTPIVRELRRKSACNFFPFIYVILSQPKISLSPYSDYSPDNMRRTSHSSLTALVCRRLAQAPCGGNVVGLKKGTLTIFARVLALEPNIEKKPSSVFFQYDKILAQPNLSVAPDVRAIIRSGYHISLHTRYACDPSWLSKVIPEKKWVDRVTLSLYHEDSVVPFAVYQNENGKLWHVADSSLREITQNPVLSWRTSCFGKLQFSYQGPILAVMLDKHMIFLNYENHTTTCQIVGSNVTFHSRLPFFWTPASKNYPSRLFLINRSWDKAYTIAYGQQDHGKHPY